MEAYEKAKKDEKLKKKEPLEVLKPQTLKEVPDFKRLHKEFADKMNKNKSQRKLTQPKPFTFHEPKNRVDLRKHMDTEN